MMDDKNSRCEPSVADKFDVLLRAMTGHSLKEEAMLWQGFMRLKNARNDFVHQGKLTVTRAETGALLQNAWAITEKVKSWLPVAMQWTDPVTSTKVEVMWVLLELPPVPENLDGAKP
jgi:hypothetical protein